eukprot:3851018-Rhodomonas_salina.1
MIHGSDADFRGCNTAIYGGGADVYGICEPQRPEPAMWPGPRRPGGKRRFVDRCRTRMRWPPQWSRRGDRRSRSS